ncbi:MAG: alcohol dehydrogenase catalytic domain-containing protein [Gammaproteobacteria bacterium]|nr:alcohol dehydrogenase catalytic domain-containing protein [Gammaproteobacteria bacterium]
MKALVYTASQEMIFREEPAPEPVTGDALVSIESVGICGSDMHAYLGHDPRRVPPLILGHEAVGTVLQGNSPGERVVLNPLITCGTCHACLGGRQNLCDKRDLIGMYRPGAFAQQITIPERNLIRVPDDMDPNKAALTEPGATALHGILLAENAAARPVSESRALVIGAGSVGLLTALILMDKGVRQVDLAETNPLRRKTVNTHTDCHTFDPVEAAPGENKYDLVFDAVGGAVTRQVSVKCAKPGAVIVHTGLMDNHGTLDVRRMTLQEITFIGCYTYTPVDLRITLETLHSGALGSLDWIELRPLEEGAGAFHAIHHGHCAAPKVVLQVQDSGIQ